MIRSGNSSWTGTFVKTFINGVLHGDRQPGESFGACVSRNTSETTFGTIDPQKLAKTIPAEAVGLAGALAGKVAKFPLTFDVLPSVRRKVYMIQQNGEECHGERESTVRGRSLRRKRDGRAEDVGREMGVSKHTIYARKAKFGERSGADGGR